MHTPSYVYQNGFGIYYFRIAIPRPLRPIIGKHEIRKSLKTTNYGYAIRLARKMAVLSEELFRSGIKDRSDIDTVFRNGISHFTQKASLIGGSSGNFGCLAEQERNIVHFQPLQEQEVSEPTKPSLKLKELIDQYIKCQEVENSWQEKTKEENKAIFKVLLAVIGNIHISDLDHQAADSFRTTLKRLPPQMNKSPKYRNKSIKQILASNPKETLSDTSVNKYMRRISAMFNFAVDRELLSKNYFRKKPIQESKKANEKRDMLTIDDLAAIFNPDRFHAEADKPFKFWIPLIGLYTGARLNEIAQLDGRDVKLIHGIWCFRFITAKQKKYTERFVPVHSKLQELGLIDYAKGQTGKLFSELHDRRDGYGHEVSKWYNRYRRRCGINDVRNKDFHSLRHTFSTGIFRMGVNPSIISELDGHVNGNGKRRTTTEEVYIKPSEVEVLQDAIEKLDYGRPLKKIKRYKELFGKEEQANGNHNTM